MRRRERGLGGRDKGIQGEKEIISLLLEFWPCRGDNSLHAI
jgi:hypothetical protein